MLTLTEIFLKARSGVYADTPENRRLHRVGQHYGVDEDGRCLFRHFILTSYDLSKGEVENSEEEREKRQKIFDEYGKTKAEVVGLRPLFFGCSPLNFLFLLDA